MAAASARPSATEPGQVEEITPLCDLVSQQAGLSSIFLLKVVKSEMVEYSYQWGGKTIQNKKVVCLLQSTRADQYCLGVAKLIKKDEPELNKLQRKFATGTTWKFKTVKLLDDKQAWIHTSCRITIDIRKSRVVSVLQSPHFPLAPEPTCNIADVLQLKHVQRFDLMAVPKEILDERSTSTGKVVFDVRLVDGSKNANDEYSSLPLTVFLKQGSEAAEFKLSVGTEPRLFMCLQGSAEKDGKVKIDGQGYHMVAARRGREVRCDGRIRCDHLRFFGVRGCPGITAICGGRRGLSGWPRHAHCLWHPG